MKVLVVNPRIGNQLKDYLPDDIKIVIPKYGTDDELIKLAGDVEVIVATRLSSEVAKAA
jgi:hypothetical protein